MRPLLLGLGLLLPAAPALAQITAGQSDDFQDGTTQGWENGFGTGGSAVTNEAGGPGGSTDRYLRVHSDGIGAEGKLVVFNTDQWTGDYTAAGLTAVSMDLNNIGATDLQIRLWLEGPGGWFVSTMPVALPAGSGWQAAALSVLPGDLTFDVGSGPGDVAATLAGVTRLRVYHSPTPSAPPPSIVGTLGLDNITAEPEPTLPDYDLEATNTTPLTVAAGGEVSFAYSITNNTAAPTTGDLWFTATPGNVSGVIRSGTLPAGATVNGTYTQNVPAIVPPGTYTYRLRIGRFPSATVDEEAFAITVTPALRQTGGEPTAWAVGDASPWSLPSEVERAALAFHAAPNPFGGATTVRFDVVEAGEVTVEVLDLVGRRVAVLADGRREAGPHVARWDAYELPSGVYLVRMTAADGVAVQRVTLLR